MKLSTLYRNAIRAGMDHDPRGAEAVAGVLAAARKRSEDLKPKEKDLFDTETLENPYSDSRLLVGAGDEEIRSILVGIDIDVAEITLAESLRNRQRNIDLLLAHHPGGRAFRNLSGVMGMQADILQLAGVPVNIAEALTEGRIREVDRRLMSANHMRAVDAARLLGYPFMCLHTAADNMVATYLQRLFGEKKPRTLDDIVDLLMEVPEYHDAAKMGAGPAVLLGSPERKAGRIFVDMTGGTEGAKDIFQSLTLSGVNTIVGMHLSEEHRKEAENQHLNVVIAGHISSDNLGMNLLLDRMIGSEPVDVIACSGFRRFPRTAKGDNSK
jgi:putative NIF3 family GTP cyclohydrolase 1 type 2